MSEKKKNSQWDFYHSRKTKPVLLKAQHIFQHGAGIYVSTSQHQDPHGVEKTQQPQQRTDYYKDLTSAPKQFY